MWHYWILEGDDLARAADDVLSGAALPALLSAAQADPSAQFHFLRYADPHFHLRIRLQVAQAATARMAADAMRDALPPRVTLREADYVPEIGKYGGPLGLALAERWFTVSSLLAMRTLKDLSDLADRAALSAIVLRRELDAISPDAGVRRECLRQYRAIWAAYAPAAFAPAMRDAATGQVGDLAALWEAGSAPYRARLSALAEDGLLGCTRESFHLNMAHLFANRCGLGPAWEVAICDAIARREHSNA